MPIWTRIQGLNRSEAFTRPLGLLESALYWDSVCSGISDTLEQLTFETPVSDSPLLRLFSSQNVIRAWLATKKLHPLLGASVHERPDASGVDFVVDEAHLDRINSNEIVFETLQSDEEACSLVDQILNGPRRLSKERLVQLWIISFPRHPSIPSSSNSYQLLLHMAHSIHDGVAQTTIIRTFFDILVNSSPPEMYTSKDSLKSHLMLHLAIDDLSPSRKYTLPRQRWRLAIARVIHSKKTAAWRGGHTLPRTITPPTVQTPPMSRTLGLKFSKELSKLVLKSCRKAKITFGHALPVLGQLAHARILHRLYAQGELSEAEWTYRITQPMHFAGPLNLRPYLDQEWLATGGAGRVCMAISFYRNTLPAMPVALTAASHVLEKPSFEALLPRARFFHRCRIAKKQTKDFLSHPLQTEFAQIQGSVRLETARLNALNWRAQLSTKGAPPTLRTAIQDIPRDEYVMSNTCSTMGDMTEMVPAEYPSGGGAWRVRLTSVRHYLRCRPGEFYITSISYHQELQLVVFCDMRTYHEGLIRAWLSDVGQAMEWYLGGGSGRSRPML